MKCLTDLNVDGLVKVFMFLNEGLHTVQGVTLVITGEEGFTSCHPVLSLLTVSVKKLWMGKQPSVAEIWSLTVCFMSKDVITWSSRH